VAAWYLSATRSSRSIDLVNYARGLTLSRVSAAGEMLGRGVRFYVPVNCWRPNYSHVLRARGVTLYAHSRTMLAGGGGGGDPPKPITAAAGSRLSCSGRLLEHGHRAGSTNCYTDTNGYTEVVRPTQPWLA